MSTDFSIEFRGSYVFVRLAPGYEITREGMARQWEAIAASCRKYGCRRVLSEGTLSMRLMSTLDAYDSGIQAAAAEVGLQMAIVLHGHKPDETTKFFKDVAANRGARIEFFGDFGAALRWLGLPAPETLSA